MELTEQQKLALFGVLQKVFILGVMTGKGQLEGASQPASQIDQALQGAMKNFSEVNPGSDLSAFLSQLLGEMAPK